MKLTNERLSGETFDKYKKRRAKSNAYCRDVKNRHVNIADKISGRLCKPVLQE